MLWSSSLQPFEIKYKGQKIILIFCLHGMLEIFPFEEHRYPAFILLHTGYYTIQYANTFYAIWLFNMMHGYCHPFHLYYFLHQVEQYPRYFITFIWFSKSLFFKQIYLRCVPFAATFNYPIICCKSFMHYYDLLPYSMQSYHTN